MSPFNWKTLTTLLILSIAVSMADSDSSEHTDKDEHSEDSKEHVEKEKENKGKEKKEKKNKEEENVNYDYDAESMLNDKDIDSMFGDPITTRSPDATGAPDSKTTPSPPLGVFGQEYWETLGRTTKTPGAPPVEASTAASESEESGSEENAEDNKTPGDSGHHGNIFYPVPRPIDLWDRLFVLAAFPICFAAVMLKAEMFR